MDRDPVDYDERQAQRAKTDARRKAAQKDVAESIQWLMRHAHGRRIVWLLLDDSRVFHSSFDADPITMAFREGRRDFGLGLLSTVTRACPDLYHKMIAECGKESDDGSSTS